MAEHKLRIVYMGTPDFAVLPLKKIIEAGFQVVGVVEDRNFRNQQSRNMPEKSV